MVPMTETTRPSAAPPAGASPFDPEGVVWAPVSPRLAVVRVIAATLVLGLPILAFLLVAVLAHAGWAWIVVAPLVVLLLWLLWLLPRQVRAIGYAERDDDLLVRRGIMFRSLVVVPYGRMQLVDVSAGPVARPLGLASIQLHTAAADTDASIPGLRAAEASDLRDRLAARGEARMAGL